MNLAMIRAFVATTLTCSLAAVGCASQADPAPPSGESQTASESEDESVGQVSQSLIACDNDVPASGFIEFPYNTVNYTARSGWKAGCVGFRIDRNLPFPQNVPAEAEALGDFPQFTGAWTPTKLQQCSNSYIDVAMGQKANEDGPYVVEHNYRVNAEANVVYDASSPSLLRITSCRAQKWRGAGCTWFPAYNYQRLDVKLVVNGNPNTPIGPAKVHATFMNDTSC